jgi:hypothetical protein
MNQQLDELIFKHLSLRWLTALIFVVSYLICAFSLLNKPLNSSLFQGAEVSHVALSLARDGTFANPFYWIPTGPTAHTAPAYVVLYALVARLFGGDLVGARVLWGLNLGFIALQLALLPTLSAELGLGVAPGAVAGILGAIVQPYRVDPDMEALFTGAALVVLCVTTLKCFKTASRPWRFALLGLLWGVAILANPECVLLMFILSHIAAMNASPEILSRSRRFVLVVFAGAALACLPWFIRNFQVFHTIVFVRDNFGIELYTSNNACAEPAAVENLKSGCHWLSHPYGNRSITMEVAQKGEIRFNHEMLRRALAWIWSNPRAFAWLTARRFGLFWFPRDDGYRYSIPIGILTLLSFAALLWMNRENRAAASLFALTLLVYPLVHYLVQVEARYRYPIFWATLLPAAYAILKIIPRPRKAGVAESSADNETQELLPV